jgi:hypothetical protein
MTTIERKSFVLPCGKTLGDSWGALRKAWLAFKIANSNGDIQTLRDYARIIRTLQLQMAIPGTIFDDDIFDEEDERELFVEISRLEMSWKKQEQIALHVVERKTSTNSCPIPPDTRVHVVERKTSTNSCPIPDYYGEAGTEKHNQGKLKKA